MPTVTGQRWNFKFLLICSCLVAKGTRQLKQKRLCLFVFLFWEFSAPFIKLEYLFSNFDFFVLLGSNPLREVYLGVIFPLCRLSLHSSFLCWAEAFQSAEVPESITFVTVTTKYLARAPEEALACVVHRRKAQWPWQGSQSAGVRQLGTLYSPSRLRTGNVRAQMSLH